MFNQLINLYNQFLTLFPPFLHFWISLILFLVIVYWFLELVRKSLIWLLLLVIFLPASIPLLKQIFWGILAFLKVLLRDFDKLGKF